MDEFALKLKEKSLDDKVNLAIDFEQGLTTTSYVTTPNPSVADLAAKRGAITTKKGLVAAKESALEMEQDDLLTLETELEVLLDRSARNSQDAVSGDRAKMTELMIPLRAIGTLTTDNPEAPTGLSGAGGDLIGEIDWNWDGSRGALFILEIGTAAAGPFAQVYVGKKSRFTSKNLTPGTEYWARVIKERNEFRSNPTSPVSQRAS